MLVKKIILGILIGAGVTACSSYNVKEVKYNQINIDSTLSENNGVEQIISPYRDSLKEEMQQVIGYANGDFFKQRPSGALGNLVCDISQDFIKKQVSLDSNIPVITVMNHGGLRNPISKGDITVGDVFKLMPFDNTLVVLKFKGESFKTILAYLEMRNGEPIAGFTYNGLYFQINNLIPNEIPTEFYLVTTDYLANGGDSMDFMFENIEKENTNILLRDVIVAYIKEKENLNPSNFKDNRLSFGDE